jgi:hypothetical protein
MLFLHKTTYLIMLACTEIHQAVWQVYLLDLLTLAKQFGKYSPDLPTFAKGHF